MVVIVTGGAGFIGSHTVELLTSKGYDVIVIDNLHSGDPLNLVGTKAVLLRVDVSDFKGVTEALRGLVEPGDVEGIVHLAAIVSIVESQRDPRRAVEVNVQGTANMLETARLLDAGRFVYASSVAVYGEPRQLPISESHPLNPVNVYGYTKLVGEKLASLWGSTYGIKAVALRYFNVYGPRMRGGSYASVVHSFLTRILRGSKPTIYGDGNQTRDFVYVEDVARANLLALKTTYTGPLNVCGGSEITINELYLLICSLLSRCPSPTYAPPRPGDVRRSLGDCSLAKRVLGWEPAYTLREGLRETLHYYLERGGTLERRCFQHPHSSHGFATTF